MMEIFTPQERKELREERRQAFERMSPEDRKKWRDEMHRPAKITN
jgi:predicted kinase